MMLASLSVAGVFGVGGVDETGLAAAADGGSGQGILRVHSELLALLDKCAGLWEQPQSASEALAEKLELAKAVAVVPAAAETTLALESVGVPTDDLPEGVSALVGPGRQSLQTGPVRFAGGCKRPGCTERGSERGRYEQSSTDNTAATAALGGVDSRPDVHHLRMRRPVGGLDDPSRAGASAGAAAWPGRPAMVAAGGGAAGAAGGGG